MIALRLREPIRLPNNVRAVPGEYVVTEDYRLKVFSSREELELSFAAEGRDVRLSKNPRNSRISNRWDVFDIIE